jgi:hypothetical protein
MNEKDGDQHRAQESVVEQGTCELVFSNLLLVKSKSDSLM